MRLIGRPICRREKVRVQDVSQREEGEDGCVGGYDRAEDTGPAGVGRENWAFGPACW